jgi:hypothetical protein
LLKTKRSTGRVCNYLVPRMSFNLGESKIGIIRVHTTNFFSSWSTKNLQEDARINNFATAYKKKKKKI